MNIVKCSNGHFYDADNYKNCPHCENNLFSEDMSTVHVSADKLYDEKTFALYGDNDGDRTLPGDFFAETEDLRAYSERNNMPFESGGPYTPDPAAYAGRDNNYYPDDNEGTIPAGLDCDTTLPADIGGDLGGLSLSDQVMTVMDPDAAPDPTKEFKPDHEGFDFDRRPSYPEAPIPAGSSAYPETQPYGEDLPASEFRRETAPETPSSPGRKPKLTISPSFNRPKPSSWPADNGENSIDFEAEREAEEYASSQEFSCMSDAFHLASFDKSLRSVDEDKDKAEESVGEEEMKAEPVSESLDSADYGFSLPEDDEYIPEYDDEAISIEDDSDEMAAADFSPLTSENLPEIAIEQPSYPEDEKDSDPKDSEARIALKDYHDVEARIEPEPILIDEEDQTSCAKTAGWLVCVEGDEAGRSIVINEGVNIIRPSAAGLSLHKGQENNDGNEAALIYDGEAGQFRLQIGFSGLMIYVNDSLALMPVQLGDRDRISWGSSEYIFVPFCNDDFRWK